MYLRDNHGVCCVVTQNHTICAAVSTASLDINMQYKHATNMDAF